VDEQGRLVSDQLSRDPAVATFITLRNGLIAEMTEIWADVDAKAPEGTRPA
jgi:hypothetical protein